MVWTIEYDPRAIDDLNRLSREVKGDIVRYLEERVAKAANPRDFGKPLRHERRGLWRYRVRDYRVICQLRDETLIVLVVGSGIAARYIGDDAICHCGVGDRCHERQLGGRRTC